MRCLTCKYCFIDFGYPGNDDQTPGQPGEWTCQAGVWRLDYATGKKETVEDALKLGEKCKFWADDGRKGGVPWQTQTGKGTKK